MDADMKKKTTLEDILFLKPMQSITSKLESLTDALYQNKKFDSNTSKKVLLNEKLTDEAMEKMIFEDLKGKSYPGFSKYFKSNYQDSLDKSMKNALKSVNARVKANELFAKKDHNVQVHEDIWKLYSTSVAFAPVRSKELVLAYDCRSNLLLHLKKYEDCMKDIDRALAITEFPLSIVKFMCRKMSCLVNMNKDTNEKRVLWLSIRDELEKINGPLKDDKFMKIINQAESDSCIHPITKTENMKESMLSKHLPNKAPVSKKEMHIIANCHFVPGEEVIVTKSTVTSANPDMFYAYCAHCLSFMWAGIPCNKCSLCMYCSEECKIEAWEKYHIIECKILPHINFDDPIYFDLQASVKVFLMGLREFGSIPKLREEIDKLKGNSKLMKKGELFDSDFLNFYILPTQCGGTELNSTCAKNACFLMAYLIETCDVFGQDLKQMKGKELSKNKDIIFCCVVILKLLLLCKLNITYPNQLYMERTIKCTQDRYQLESLSKRSYWNGTIFHPFRSMFERSCNPNVAGFWRDNGQIVYLCVQPIKKLEKITICLSAEFFYWEKAQRNVALIYNDSVDICRCDPCIKGWPTMVKLYKKFQQRHLKSETREMKIVQEYLKKNDMVTDKVVEKNWKLNESELQQLAKDLNDVYNVCGQPSFASSFLITILCASYEILYGAVPLQLHIPKDC